MKFSERWLRTMADPPLGTAALCDTLTMAGLEVEATEPAAPPFSGVVVARIEAVAPHPDADRLRVCTVDAGTDSRLAIVCGAPNAAAGMTVACALVGAQLPGGLAI
ncbi:MAG: phenylalanine--tRNA ligase subunit beta, partial [Burkholderiales bacterium]|nr:phenylalanine--tRNA ligase subunit beta [Burkholderiales bacterium]